MIGILNCDQDESPETNGAFLVQALIPDSEIIDICKGERISQEYDAFVITGSRSSINDDEEWISYLRGFVLGLDVPCLAICFGMQLVADVFGGKVASGVVDERGFVAVGDRLVYEYHHDAVMALPPGAVNIVSNEVCIQSFVLGNYHCVQYHPEITGKVANVMAARDGLEKVDGSFEDGIETIKDWVASL